MSEQYPGAEPLKEDRHELFCHEYLIDLNIKCAAVRAGFSETSARQHGWVVFNRPEVQERIKYLNSSRLGRIAIDADYVLRRLIEIDQMDVLDIMNDNLSFKPVSEWPPVWRQYLAGLDNFEEFEGYGEDREMIGMVRKIKWPDKVKNLKLLGDHVAVGAFKDKHGLETELQLKQAELKLKELELEKLRKDLGNDEDNEVVIKVVRVGKSNGDKSNTD